MSGYRADLEALLANLNVLIDRIRVSLLKHRDNQATYAATEELLRETKAIRGECSEMLSDMRKEAIQDYAMALKKLRASFRTVSDKLGVD